MSKNKGNRLYIDADMLVYKLGYASEHRGRFPDGTKYSTPDLGLAKRLIKGAIKSYCLTFGTDDYKLILSGTGNWRFSFYPEYKANRATLVKPLSYEAIREWIANLPETITVDNIEADDYMAAIASGGDTDSILITADKDFFTIPGQVYHISSERLFSINVNQTFSFLFYQALAGDRVDGYYGVRWMGEAKCKRLLHACQGKTIKQAYLFIKKQVQKRAVTLEGKKELWAEFKKCIDLAALTWYDEEASRGIGIRRVWKHRNLKFEYFLPYYDLLHNRRYGEPAGKPAGEVL